VKARGRWFAELAEIADRYAWPSSSTAPFRQHRLQDRAIPSAIQVSLRAEAGRRGENRFDIQIAPPSVELLARVTFACDVYVSARPDRHRSLG
jgi:hypothetical protein